MANAFELPLQDWELSDARAAFVETLLVDQMELRRQVNVPTGRGGQTEVYVSLGFFPCRFEGGRKARVSETGGAARSDTRWEFSLPGDLLIEPTDLILLRGNAYQPLEGDNLSTTQFINSVYCRRLYDVIAVIMTPAAMIANPATQPATLVLGP